MNHDEKKELERITQDVLIHNAISDIVSGKRRTAEETDARITQLEAENAALRKQLRALEAEVQKLRVRECPGCGKCMDRYCPTCQKDLES